MDKAFQQRLDKRSKNLRLATVKFKDTVYMSYNQKYFVVLKGREKNKQAKDKNKTNR